MKIYESYTADTKLLPPRYKDAIQYIITGVSHKIQNNDWTTTIQSISGPKYTGFAGTGDAPKITTHPIVRKKTTTFKTPTGPTEPGGGNKDTTVASNGVATSKHEEIIQKAINALFSNGETEGQCARGTGTMVINAVAIAAGGVGREMRKGDSNGGSAKASAHHDWIESQGWTKYSWTGLTEAEIKVILKDGPIDSSDPTKTKRLPWIAGDVACYWNTDGKTSDKYKNGAFHSQYYTNGLYDKRYLWGTDEKSNFADNGARGGFVYDSFDATEYSLVILKTPIFK